MFRVDIKFGIAGLGGAFLGNYISACDREVVMRGLVVLLLAVCLALPSFAMAGSATAIPRPSVPEFTIKQVDNSYDVPTTYSIDPYTGVTVTHPGHHVTNRTVELVIKNQPFVSTNSDGWNTSFFYNVRMKGHYGDDWVTLYNPTVTPYYAQENSEYTVISFGEFSSNSKIDFQVQALVGYVHRISNGSATNILDKFPWVFDGETSGWSATHTLTIIEASSTPAPSSATLNPSDSPLSPTQTPLEPNVGTSVLSGLDWVGMAILVLLCVVVVLLVLLVVFLGKRRVG
ncbi:MAG: hypothetical protein NWE93_14610 [Candidatus Bathyarchaeota archaeon]|nr:hypothetical protein [Candidatus Bathyarchaeota archaeon]